KIAAPQRHQARDLQSIAQRKGVIERSRIVDVVLSVPPSLLGKPLRPKDPRENFLRRDPLVVLKSSGVRTANGIDIVLEHGCDVLSRAYLVSEVVWGNAAHPF